MVQSIRKGIVFPILVCLTSAFGGGAVEGAGPPPAPEQEIDALIEQKLADQGQVPNEAIDDATFLRRIYLDLVGRIATFEEAENFYARDPADRRSELIDDLLASDGYVSHFYHFWADLLRINKRLGLNETPDDVEYAYRLWVKKALHENLPYDEFVRQLVSAEGHSWDNGAVGYYQRDRGMPLDNMSNTVRVFLGTRLECAQCHDHPFDHWTQMDYYKMAAFSYGMQSKGHTHANREALRNYLESQADEPRGRAQQISKAEEMLHVRVRYVTTREKPRALQLPHDYQYSDASPLDEVPAQTMFGESADASIDDYANWMTSKRNPTFTRVIANRLWKKVFGAGLFEPLDEITDTTTIHHPQLMALLEQLMQDLDYDMKAFLAVLCRTRAYQREATEKMPPAGGVYLFPGPVFRRMTAEQIWDSVIAQVLPEADCYRPNLKRELRAIHQRERIYKALADMPEEEYIAGLVDLSESSERDSAELAQIRKQLPELIAADELDRVQGLQKRQKELLGELGQRISLLQKNPQAPLDDTELLSRFGMVERKVGSTGSALPNAAAGDELWPVVVAAQKPSFPRSPKGMAAEQVKEWRAETQTEYRAFLKLVAKWARAAELSSPAPRGHFLRDFGQSDREMIDNAANQASVPQALNLLNGPLAEALTNRFSVLGNRVHQAESPDEKVALLFEGLLTRKASEQEVQWMLGEIETSGEKAALQNIAWALINTRQFLFVR